MLKTDAAWRADGVTKSDTDAGHVILRTLVEPTITILEQVSPSPSRERGWGEGLRCEERMKS
jgi:hypothetical protein